MTSTLSQPLTQKAVEAVEVEVVDDGCCASAPLSEAELKRRALFRRIPPGKQWIQPPPDHVSRAPSLGEKVFWTEPDAEATIRMAAGGLGSMQPTTINVLFQVAAETFPSKPAMMVEREGVWQSWTWAQYYSDAMVAARALVTLGLEASDTVNIIGFNSPEFFIAEMAAILAGGKAAGIYTTNAPDACKYVAEHSEAKVAFVEDEKQLRKFLAIRDALPQLKAIVVWAEPVPPDVDASPSGGAAVLGWPEFLALAQDTPADVVARRSNAVRPGHCANLIYTSGTTGNPKAVMLSHDNYIYNTYGAIYAIFGTEGLPHEFRMVSYLPLSHVAAQILDLMFPIVMAAAGVIIGHRGLAPSYGCTWFARPDALKGTLKQTLVACKPTFFLGVPRVWEKFREAMMAIGAKTTGLKKSIATWAKAKGLKASVNRQLGGSGARPSFHGLATKLVLKKVLGALGLDECLACITGSAPMPRVVIEYFGALDIDIFDVYGMSESAGGTSGHTPHIHQWATVGPPLVNHEVRIEHVASRGDKPGEGEICYRGRHIMMGYMRDEKKTAEAIDKDGWLHSGDVGAFTPEGLLRITGRLKELIITAGGENIAPVPIEDKIKELCPAISNAMMVGDQRKYNVCLLTVKTLLDAETGVSTGELTLQAAEVDAELTTSEQVAQQCKSDPTSAWAQYIHRGIGEYNAKFAVSNAQKIQKFAVVPGDFSERGGELTATLKLKRGPTTEKYKALIDELYM